MLYFLYVAGFSLAKIIPLRICYIVAELIARLYYVFARRDREELRANLKVVLGEGADEADINRCILGIFRNFAKYLADFFKLPRFTEGYISSKINITGLEYLDECLAEGKGAILLSVHLGNWELGGAVLAALRYPMSAIVLKHADRNINDFFIRQRAINNLRSITVGTQIKECFRVLRRNEFLCIVGEKDYTSSGIYVDFFGRKARMPKGPAVFALRTGAPIIFSVMVREKDDTFSLRIEKPIRYKPCGNYDEDIRALMGEYLKDFEKYIREYPDQWYAFRKIWNPEQVTQ